MAVAVQRAARAAVPAPAPTRARPRPRPAAAPAETRQRARAASPRLAKSVVWIALAATLLAGIVALNVAALELRLDRGKVQSQVVQVRAENSALAAELSTAAAVGRIQAGAERLGLVEATDTSYEKLGRRAR